jgi:endonuclease YncB( thermonuclease family)
MKLLLCIITFTLPLLTAPAIAHADDLKGNPRVIDGDTIWIGPTKIRLHGIDTVAAR